MSIRKLRDQVVNESLTRIKVAPGYANLPQIWQHLSPSCFGPLILGYYPPAMTDSVFAQTYKVEPPFIWKAHVSPAAEDALRVAQFALPILLLRDVPHKVA